MAILVDIVLLMESKVRVVVMVQNQILTGVQMVLHLVEVLEAVVIQELVELVVLMEMMGVILEILHQGILVLEEEVQEL